MQLSESRSIPKHYVAVHACNPYQPRLDTSKKCWASKRFWLTGLPHVQMTSSKLTSRYKVPWRSMKYSPEGLLQVKQNCKDSMGLGGLEINICTYDLLTKIPICWFSCVYIPVKYPQDTNLPCHILLVLMTSTTWKRWIVQWRNGASQFSPDSSRREQARSSARVALGDGDRMRRYGNIVTGIWMHILWLFVVGREHPRTSYVWSRKTNELSKFSGSSIGKSMIFIKSKAETMQLIRLRIQDTPWKLNMVCLRKAPIYTWFSQL